MYEAPPECPDARTFGAEVEKRAPGAQTAGARVSIRGSQTAGYDGRLMLDEIAREVHADTCGETMQALALAVALATSEDVPDAASAPEASPVTKSAAHEPERARDGAALEPPRRLRPVLGLGLGGVSGVGPGVAAGVAIFGGLDFSGRSIRIGVSGARSAEVRSSIGSGRLARALTYVDGCPISVRSSAVELSPCARFDAGVLHSSGESLENAESTTLLWFAISGGGRVDVDLASAIFIEGEARAVMPLLRHGFFVRPNETVYRVPVVAAEAFVSVGHRFSK